VDALRTATEPLTSREIAERVAGEVYRLPTLHRQRRNAVHLIAIGAAAVIFAPRRLLRIAEEICPRNVMVDADFSAAQTAEVLFRPIRARTIERIGFLMVDPFDFETLMQVVP
jgi:hypothetical protein